MIAFIYCLTTCLVFYLLKDKLNKLEKRIQSMEDFLLGKVIAENEVDD